MKGVGIVGDTVVVEGIAAVVDGAAVANEVADEEREDDVE